MILNERDKYLIKRRNLKITHQEIADYIGVNQSSISRYERGEINFKFEKEYKEYINNKIKKGENYNE